MEELIVKLFEFGKVTVCKDTPEFFILFLEAEEERKFTAKDGFNIPIMCLRFAEDKETISVIATDENRILIILTP